MNDQVEVLRMVKTWKISSAKKKTTTWEMMSTSAHFFLSVFSLLGAICILILCILWINNFFPFELIQYAPTKLDKSHTGEHFSGEIVECIIWKEETCACANRVKW